MQVRQLETIISAEAGQRPLSGRAPADIALRFRSLRRNGLLPRAAPKTANRLSNSHIAAAVLSIVPAMPEYAGLTSRVLMRLRPVGGETASFMEKESFGEALAALLDDHQSLRSLAEIRVSDGEIFTNAYGHAAIRYRSDEKEETAYYVPSTAISLLQRGAEISYDPTNTSSSISDETIFRPDLFRKIIRAKEKQRAIDALYPELVDKYDIDEEDDDESREKKRREKLGIIRGSRFLNVGVDNQGTWPKEETLVEFDGYYLVLMPKTRRNSTSVHIDLFRNRLSDEDALTVINRFLSILTWCDDQHAINHGGWSGSPVPVAVPKPNLAFTTAYYWAFDRRIPENEESRKAIAIYRESRNAEENALVGYAVLGYYKIVELRHKGRADTTKWFAQKFDEIRRETQLSDRIERFLSSFTGQEPEHYLYRACRTAVAHANKPSSLDPDDLNEIRRMHVAADILRELARRFISDELGVSTCTFDGS